MPHSGLTTNHVDRTATRREALFSFWVAVLTAALAAAALAIALTTPPRSGPYCSMSCIAYPYTNAAAFVPRDYLWMYPAALVSVTFVVLVTCVHRRASDDSKHTATRLYALKSSFVVLVTCVHRRASDDLRAYSLVAVCFASLGAALVLSDYVIQIAVVQPSLLDGQAGGLSLFSQYNPHGIFIALEDGGYSLISVAFLFTGLSIGRLSTLERLVRRLLVISAVAVIGVLVSLSLIFGKDLDYRFEVIALSIDWIVLMVAGVLLGVVFKRLMRASRPAPHVAATGERIA